MSEIVKLLTSAFHEKMHEIEASLEDTMESKVQTLLKEVSDKEVADTSNQRLR